MMKAILMWAALAPGMLICASAVDAQGTELSEWTVVQYCLNHESLNTGSSRVPLPNIPEPAAVCNAGTFTGDNQRMYRFSGTQQENTVGLY